MNTPNVNNLWQASIKISRPGTSKTDEELTEGLVEAHRMGKNAARVVKQLYGDHLAATSKAEARARKDHHRLTFEGIGNIRLVVLGEREHWLSVMEKHAAEHRRLAQEFMDNWDLIMEQERIDKNGTFRVEDYPSRESIASTFDFKFGVLPMPQPNQFITDAFTDDLGKKLAAEYETRLANVSEQVRRTILNTMLTLIADTAESLAGDGPIIDSEKRKGPLAKLQEYLDRVPMLNINNDPQINQVFNAARSKLNFSAERLRDSKVTRQLAAAQAHNIALQFGSSTRKLSKAA
jgi:hypothetical protein